MGALPITEMVIGVPLNEDIEASIRRYLDGESPSEGRKPDARYASFDYCFNYFQSFRERGNTPAIACPENLQNSCLQLGFYLASWGMMRGSAPLHKESLHSLVPFIEVVARTRSAAWEIDADCYTEDNIQALIDLAQQIDGANRGANWRASETLVTKIMLGVFGSVPAFDTFFRRGFEVSGLNVEALRRLGAFYAENAEAIEKHRVPTLDFLTGQPTERRYTRAKVLDMLFFIEGGGARATQRSHAQLR